MKEEEADVDLVWASRFRLEVLLHSLCTLITSVYCVLARRRRRLAVGCVAYSPGAGLFVHRSRSVGTR